MSNLTKIVIAVIVMAVVGGVYWAMSDSEYESSYGLDSQSMKEVTTSDTLSTGADASNPALDDDLSTVDAQLSAFEADNANVNAGLNDQAVEQSSL